MKQTTQLSFQYLQIVVEINLQMHFKMYEKCESYIYMGRKTDTNILINHSCIQPLKVRKRGQSI